MREIRYNVDQLVLIADEEKKVIANKEKGRQGPEKDTHRLRPLCAGSHHDFSQKQPKDHVVFHRTIPPIVVLHGTLPPPLNGPRSLCTVPSQISAFKLRIYF